MPILSSVFTDEFFQGVNDQIEALRNNEWDPLHPLYKFLMRYDALEGFPKLKLLKEYLKLISTAKISKKQLKHIKKELVSFDRINSLNTLFEISILGMLLDSLPSGEIELYPKTIDNKNVEAKIILIDRPIYIETAVLGESDYDSNIRESMRKRGIRSWGGARKLEEKAEQFIPDQPNVLILAKFDFWPDEEIHIKPAMQIHQFSKIGLVIQFSRMKLKNIFKENLDKRCILSGQEETKLLEILRNNYKVLIHSDEEICSSILK